MALLDTTMLVPAKTASKKLGRSQRPSSVVVACVILAVLLGLSSATTQAASVPIVNIDPTSNWAWDEDHGNGMVGWLFSLQQSIIVRQVGIYDSTPGGLSRAFQVGLWQDLNDWFDPSDNPTQLLGTPSSGISIPAGTTASVNGVWGVVNLSTPLVLGPGYYELGMLDTATTPDVIRYYQTDYSDPSLGLTTYEFFYADIPGQTGFHWIDGERQLPHRTGTASGTCSQPLSPVPPARSCSPLPPASWAALGGGEDATRKANDPIEAAKPTIHPFRVALFDEPTRSAPTSTSVERNPRCGRHQHFAQKAGSPARHNARASRGPNGTMLESPLLLQPFALSTTIADSAS